ncbi:hypothetical protein Tco_0668140 [Tanacetum coccineum]
MGEKGGRRHRSYQAVPDLIYFLADEEAFSSQFYEMVLVSEFIKNYLNIQVLRPFSADEILKVQVWPHREFDMIEYENCASVGKDLISCTVPA